MGFSWQAGRDMNAFSDATMSAAEAGDVFGGNLSFGGGMTDEEKLVVAGLVVLGMILFFKKGR